MSAMDVIRFGKHAGKRLHQVIKDDPNYALWGHSKCSWFPKMTPEEIESCNRRYRYLRHDWSTYDMADYGDDWV